MASATASSAATSAASSTASSAMASSTSDHGRLIEGLLDDHGVADLVGEVVLDRVAVGDALEAQRQAPAVGVDLDHPHRQDVALVDHLTRVLHVVGGELGDVHQTLDAGVDLHEGTERDDLRDATLDHVVHLVALDDALPRVGLGLLEAQGDPLAVAVDVEHLDVDLLADLEHLGGVVDVAPGQLGDVDQAVDPVEVHEGAELHDVGDDALHDLARLELVEDLLAHLAPLVLEHRAP